MFGRKILLLLFLFYPEISAFSQTLYLLPLKVNHVKDSVVEIKVDEKKNGIWNENSRWRNVYSFNKEGHLQKAEIWGQQYSIKYKNGAIGSVKISREKMQTELIYYYNEKRQVYKIATYNFINNSREFWGNEYIEYDSLNNVISSSYVVDNKLSMHPGYDHSAHYEYDSLGRLIAEDWGHEKKSHYYNAEGKLAYTLITDNEFGTEREYRRQYQVFIVK